ncbi:hypothetical protein NZL82_13885 [Sphingomonas sanguinis]|uniref:hypothetical protein n=1 Tax=Sphingomonas sp. LC-1 TaxID=3110957 RepID=UPI0021BB7E96|nr:hypothetical protein [Sphingomonas sp. LC-1]MCT8002966.1 hypothetical protein [Sphingomonas sp. LC-1]
MAAEASRAPSGREQTNFAQAKPPRFPNRPGSMAAAAAIAAGRDDSMAEAWVTLWQACRGNAAVAEDGKLVTYGPFVDRLTAVPIHDAGFSLSNADEQSGAIKALAALLHLAGPLAVAEVTALVADQNRGA